uniref:hypothetical protein n=1 Tax=Carboxylicivirga fragile TaxID=3417571 RepID=UPI003D34D223|nr:hypothetical protein [Marinilabiliaceae bacterium N1Y90]
TLYADFINSLDIAQEKKENLLLKIEELKQNRINKLNLEKDKEINALKKEADSKIHHSTIQKDNILTEIENFKLEQQKIRDNEIALIDDKNSNHQDEIEKLEVEFTRTKVKWYELIPLLVLLTGLLSYLVVFYSSAAYILIFGKKDAMMTQKKGLDIVPPEVFEPEAWSKAADHGNVAYLFITLFVMIPIALSLMKKYFKDPQWYINLIAYALIIIVDGFIAYAVAKSIHEVEYLSGTINTPFEFSQIFTNADFYLVFVMGALGLFLFKLIYEKIHSAFDDRNLDATRSKNLTVKKQLQKKIMANEKEKKNHLQRVTEINQKILLKDNEKNTIEKDLAAIPLRVNADAHNIDKNFSIHINEIEDVATMYEHKIKNNDLKFSVHALRDRINTFLNGWVNYLHGKYSIPNAKQMTADANNTKDEWLHAKLQSQNNSKVPQLN